MIFLYELHYAPQMVSVWVLAVVNKILKCENGARSVYMQRHYDTSVFSLFFCFLLFFHCGEEGCK